LDLLEYPDLGEGQHPSIRLHGHYVLDHIRPVIIPTRRSAFHGQVGRGDPVRYRRRQRERPGE